MVPRAGIEPARCCHRGIFLPTTAFAAALKKHLWSGLSLHRICNYIAVANLGGCRQVSTRSTVFTGLRSGLPSPLRVKVSPNLTPFTTKFPIVVLNLISPLRLPISPPGQMTFLLLS